jgi:hypothetical protein
VALTMLITGTLLPSSRACGGGGRWHGCAAFVLVFRHHSMCRTCRGNAVQDSCQGGWLPLVIRHAIFRVDDDVEDRPPARR